MFVTRNRLTIGFGILWLSKPKNVAFRKCSDSNHEAILVVIAPPKDLNEFIIFLQVMEMLKSVRKNAMRLGEEALQADKDSRDAFERLSADLEEEITSTTKDQLGQP